MRWSVPTLANGAPNPAACRAVQGVGACWAEIGDKWPSTTEFKVYDLVGELDQLMDEALNLVLARAIGVPSQPQSEL